MYDVAFWTFIVTLAGVCITLYKIYWESPRLEFYESDTVPFFKYSNTEEYHYLNSECIAFIHLKIANPSKSQCTIREFTLHVDGYKDATFKSSTRIRDEYIVKGSYSEHNRVRIIGDRIIKMPAILPPYGYVEGFILFPDAPKYPDTDMTFEVIAHTAKDDFCYSAVMKFGFPEDM